MKGQLLFSRGQAWLARDIRDSQLEKQKKPPEGG
jgi:hypothetical protein